MDIRFTGSRVLFAIMTLLVSFSCAAQLPSFTLGVTPAPQTCLGNGSLAFTVTGNNPAASMDYAVYLLPNTTTPVVIVTTPGVGGLVAGNYLVVATQSLAGQSNTATANATITSTIIPLAYSLTPSPARCGNDGTITVNVTSGTAASYEILAGPVTIAPQASNVFTGLQAGTYQVRVHDTCGEAVVMTYILVQANTGLVIPPVIFSGGELPDCNKVTIGHNIQVSSPSYQVFYPLTCQFTIFPPGGGAPQVVTQVITSGMVNGVAITADIPFFYGQQYTYNIIVTDACGNTFNRNGSVVNRTLIAGVEQEVENCGNNAFTVKPEYYVGPVTINFTTVPAGFNPVAFNPGHPTFDLDEIPYGDVDTNPVPEGTYVFQLTDACGHTVTREFEVEDPEVSPQVMPEVLGCTAQGKVTIEMPGREITSVVITAAPEAYPDPLEDNVSEFITDGEFEMEGLPLGNYVVVITDSCGEIYEEPFELEGVPTPFNVSQLPGCEEGFGSLRITAQDSGISMIEIIDAPDEFTETLPFNVTVNVDSMGRFYMNSLPGGNYIFRIVDDCGVITEKPVALNGYHIQVNEIDVTPNCNSFNLNLQHTSNGGNLLSFWLQRYDPVAGVWEHPVTGANYMDGATPNSSSAYLLNNNANNINIASTGQFRVMKLCYIYSNGSNSNFRCLEEIHTFNFDGGPEITDAYSFPCAGGLTEVLVVAEGVPPLTYRITTKNDQPFVVENGTSNHFSGLESAAYNFQVTDFCGNIRNIQFDVNGLDPIEMVAQGFCEGEASSLSVEEFSFLDYEWWKQGEPGTILSTTGTLSFPAFNSATQAGTYFVNITSPIVGSCVEQLLQYEVHPNILPNAGNDNTLSFCNDGEALNLDNYLSPAYTPGGTWSDVDNTGGLAGNVFNTGGISAGTYSFSYKVTGLCNLEDEAIITIELKDTPAPPVIEPVAPICEGTPLQFSVTPVAGASYLWTGPGNFTSSIQNPLLSGTTVAQSGNYSLMVTVNGCASPASVVPVIIDASPVAGADNNLSICNDGAALNLEDYLSSGYTAGGTWQDADNSGGLSGSELTTTAIPAGTYRFIYKVTAACGQEDESVIAVELKARPVAPVIAPVPPACDGSDIQLSLTAIPNASYHWTGPGNFSSTQQNPVLTGANVVQGGIYSVIATVNGCASPASAVMVIVNVIPEFTIAGNTSFCDGQSTVLSVVPGNVPVNGVTYLWYHDDVLMAGIDASAIEVFETGNYRVEVSNNGCMSADEVAVAHSTGMFAIQPEAGCRNDEYVLSVANLSDIQGNISLVWTGPQGYYFAGDEAVITDHPPGEYFVEATNADGCTENASVIVDNTSCLIPRGISPNNDGYNNAFDLSNLDVKHIKIFNRYGLEVYEKDNYINEWYGQSHRGELPTGTYYYVITLSAGKQVTGWVYLQREIK
ncbi:gliding motility-associated C-terminal domain-containing protein [uncultured Flavobacterium sp.]|uniref:T9SS type B sorting domain-containing protein n=1 Tax=uncultured Flavobacterium sp. TaxID=165435 RepID=UPI0025CE59F6|nr:gliding motility-associated C-terminal domain-containing protein [uncultured Flavobacterium sp.]